MLLTDRDNWRRCPVLRVLCPIDRRQRGRLRAFDRGFEDGIGIILLGASESVSGSVSSAEAVLESDIWFAPETSVRQERVITRKGGGVISFGAA